MKLLMALWSGDGIWKNRIATLLLEARVRCRHIISRSSVRRPVGGLRPSWGKLEGAAASLRHAVCEWFGRHGILAMHTETS